MMRGFMRALDEMTDGLTRAGSSRSASARAT